MWLEAPEIAASAKPGQFVMLQCGGDTLLRRPISIHRVKDSRIAVLYANLGRGTDWLSKQKASASISVLGPLGNGYTIDEGSQNLLLIAGGMGIAPMPFLAETALAQNKNVALLIGARSNEILLPQNLLPADVECIIATDDGSVGICGRTTDVLPDCLGDIDSVFACGPAPMYRTMNSSGLLKGRPCQVSLEIRMACGVGVCYGCTIKTTRGLKQVCDDGPVFEFSDILWDELADI